MSQLPLPADCANLECSHHLSCEESDIPIAQSVGTSSCPPIRRPGSKIKAQSEVEPEEPSEIMLVFVGIIFLACFSMHKMFCNRTLSKKGAGVRERLGKTLTPMTSGRPLSGSATPTAFGSGVQFAMSSYPVVNLFGIVSFDLVPTLMRSTRATGFNRRSLKHCRSG